MFPFNDIPCSNVETSHEHPNWKSLLDLPKKNGAFELFSWAYLITGDLLGALRCTITYFYNISILFTIPSGRRTGYPKKRLHK